MNKRLGRAAKVIDEENIDYKEDFLAQEMYSLRDSGVNELYSSMNSDTCGSRNMSTSGEFVEVLNFKHFARYMSFSKTDPRGAKKEISTSLHVSVVMRVV